MLTRDRVVLVAHTLRSSPPTQRAPSPDDGKLMPRRPRRQAQSTFPSEPFSDQRWSRGANQRGTTGSGLQPPRDRGPLAALLGRARDVPRRAPEAPGPSATLDRERFGKTLRRAPARLSGLARERAAITFEIVADHFLSKE